MTDGIKANLSSVMTEDEIAEQRRLVQFFNYPWPMGPVIVERGESEMAMDNIEAWIVGRYGRITYDEVQFPQFGWSIVAAVVPVMGGVAIGMGIGRQLGNHDLYLKLTNGGELESALPEWWQQRADKRKESGSDG